MTAAKKNVVLCILDGWGEREAAPDNAITSAHMPVWTQLLRTYPHTQLEASAAAVGLPRQQMGNSEVGHMTIGLGRVVAQDLPRIDYAIAHHELAHDPTLLGFIKKIKADNNTCHLLGLLSPGGVHSHQAHLLYLAAFLARHGVKVWIHAFLDGRDTPPRSANDYLAQLLAWCGKHPHLQLATFGGRYYAMDRDKRWERTQQAYQAMVAGQASVTDDPLAVIKEYYQGNIFDEFIPPHIMTDYPGMKSGDGLLMGNFRADRVRQILAALLLPDFTGFPRPDLLKFSATLGLKNYSEELKLYIPALFAPQPLQGSLGEIIAQQGWRQLRIAETEKYAHVTFFFNGGRELMFPGEERVLVPSPKVTTYDLMPEMSALEVTDKAVEAITGQGYALIVVNYANPDMVGHTGVTQAVVKAVEILDQCLGRLRDAALATGAVLVITADHGNAEQMYDESTQQPHTAHTCNPVPFILINGGSYTLEPGGLADIAPTILKLMGVTQPSTMSGQPLLNKK